MCPEDIVVLVTAVSLGIAQGHSETELNYLGAVFTQIGDNLILFASQCALNDECCEKCNSQSKSSSEQVNDFIIS